MSIMDEIVSLCKRRGFLFQSSEIYGGLQGFWDYGPLGVELKRNLKDAWWQDMVSAHDTLTRLPGSPYAYEMVGLDSTIITHPQVWKCSGHYDMFHDYMVDCRESKKRYRFDQIRGQWVRHRDELIFVTTLGDSNELDDIQRRALKFFKLRPKDCSELFFEGPVISLDKAGRLEAVLGPDAKAAGTLTEPREFNLMFKTTLGAVGGENEYAFLRPETAQGIFVNFRNVVDSSRVSIPFGIAQIGKSFRNEITPRNFTFRSREFEQMEIEFFCHPSQSSDWYSYWRERRLSWYVNLGLPKDSLRVREHEASELAHYSLGTADIEFAFPFLPAGEYGELEGVAHRGDFDLRSHMEGKLDPSSKPMRVELNIDGKPRYRGSGKDLTYRDEVSGEKFLPHVIEPSAGADRGVLAFLCGAYQEDFAPDENGELKRRIVLRLHPRLSPFKAAVLPLVRKDGMPEMAKGVYSDLKREFNIDYDEKAAIGRRYRRQDEIGTPFCITIDGVSLQDGTVTLRDRDSLQQRRVRASDLSGELRKAIRAF